MATEIQHQAFAFFEKHRGRFTCKYQEDKAKKLAEEVVELAVALEVGDPSMIRDEIADVFLILTDIAMTAGIDTTVVAAAKLDHLETVRWKQDQLG